MRLKLALISFMTVILAISSVTLAYLSQTTDSLENRFVPGKVDQTIHESFDGTTKEHVSIKNTGNVEVYVRVVLAANWLSCPDTEGSAVISSCSVAGPAPLVQIELNETSSWFLASDGFYYYKALLLPGQTTSDLLESFTPPTQRGYHYALDVVSSTIQGDQADLVSSKWIHVSVDGEGRLGRRD